MQKTTLLLLVISCLTLWAYTSQAQMQLIYAHDENGEKLTGSKDALIAAIRSGKQVRLGWKMGNGVNTVEHFADAQMVTIMNGEVYAQITPIISQSPKFNKNTITFNAGMKWSMIACTNGVNTTLYYDMSDGKAIQEVNSKWGNQWFIAN